MSRALLLSVHPTYADDILSGKKTVELRRIRPQITKNEYVYLYVTAPVKSIVGAFIVENVLIDTIEKLWEFVQGRAAISSEEYLSYFDGASKGVAIFFKKVMKLDKPISLEQLKKWWPNFHPPQVHRYLNGDKKMKLIESRLIA